jgi:hypothetical protein
MTEYDRQIIRACIGRVLDLIVHTPVEHFDIMVEQAIDDVEQAVLLREQRMAERLRELGIQPH